MEEQVLMFGDGCYTIVNKSSIIFDSKNSELQRGSEVAYLWPEKAVHKKTFSGIIVEISMAEDELVKLRTQKINEDKKKFATRRRNIFHDDDSENVDNQQAEKKRKKKEDEAVRREANILSAKELLKTLDETKHLNSNVTSVVKKVDTAIRLIKNLTHLLDELKQELKDFEKEATPDVETEMLLEERNNSFLNPTVRSSLVDLTSNHRQGPSASNQAPSFSNREIFHTKNQTPPNRAPSSNRDTSFNSSQTSFNTVLSFTQTPLSNQGFSNSASYSNKVSSSFNLIAGYSSDSDIETQETEKDPNPTAEKENTPPIDNDEEKELFEATKDTPKTEAVELLKDSGIFIMKKALDDANKKANSQTTLARMLMCFIFKEEALGKHSLTGRGQTEDRPGLPVEAIKCVLKYSRQTAKLKKKDNWKLLDDRLVKSSLRSKLFEIQSKSKPISK